MNSGDFGDFGSESKGSDLFETGRDSNFGVIGDIGGDLPLTEAAEWPDPVEFEVPVELPAFPTDALPSPCADMCREVSEVVQIAPDVPATMALAVYSVAGGGRFKIRVGNTHDEPMSLYCVAGLGSGERKTATLGHILAPVHQWERTEIEREGPALTAAIEANKAIDARIERLRTDAAKNGDVDVRDLMKQIEELERQRLKVPPYPTVLIQDITPEALGRKLAQQRGRALIASDEGGPFQIMAGQYSKTGAANLDIYLKGHAGSPITVERISRLADKIPHPALSLAMSVQPSIIQSITCNVEFRQRGLLARVLYCTPMSMVGRRKYVDRAINCTIADAYQRSVLHAFGTIEDFPPEPAFIEIRGAAHAAWVKCHDDFERELVGEGKFAAIPDWGSKAPGAVARIAGAIHLIGIGHADPTRIPISAETIERARVIVMYHSHHALAALAETGSVKDRQARRVLGWILRQGNSTFSRRTCQQNNKSWIETQQLDEALTILEERHFIRRSKMVEKRGPGRPSGEDFQVNPKLFRKPQTSCQKSQKPQNSQTWSQASSAAPKSHESIADSGRQNERLKNDYAHDEMEETF